MSKCIIVMNPFRPKRNGEHFADSIFKHIFMICSICIFINISVKFVSKCPIVNGEHFADSIFKHIFMICSICIFINISVKFVSKCPIVKKSRLIQVGSWVYST